MRTEGMDCYGKAFVKSAYVSHGPSPEGTDDAVKASARTFLEFRETLPNWLTLIVFTRRSKVRGNRYCFANAGFGNLFLWGPSPKAFRQTININ